MPLSPETEKFIDNISPFSEKCPQLQIFLHREGTNNDFSDYDFLMVSPSCFGKVQIRNISIEETYIIIEFLDYAVNRTGKLRINIFDPDPKVIFVDWKDITNMVYADRKSIINDSGLLEFE
jgi:hypothetical protein